MRKIFTLVLLLVGIGSYAQLSNVQYFVRTDRMYHSEGGVGGNCWEPGSEEYTGYGGFRDEVNTSVSWSPCQTCTNNSGSCTYGYNVYIGNRTNGTYRIYFQVDGWEDDRGGRCSFDDNGSILQNDDDCRTGPGDRGFINFRELSYPGNIYTSGINSAGGYGDSDFRVWFDVYWRYTGSPIANRITMSCTPQNALQTSGGIRSQSVYLTSGIPYVFETTSGDDTYLRLFGSDGYTIVAFNDDGGQNNLSKISYTPSTSGWYYIETSEFSRQALATNANLRYYIDDVPAAPVVSDVIACEDQNVILQYSGANIGTIKWYLTNISGAVLHTGNTYNVGNSLAPGVYYRYATATSSSGCESARREVKITVKPKPSDAPVVADATICPNASASLLASNPGGASLPANNFNWYDDNSLSTIIYTGAIYNTPNLSTPPAMYTYYVVGVLDGCLSDSTSVTVDFYAANSPTASNDTSACIGDQIILSASAAGSSDIRWYTNSDLTGYIQSGTTFTTPPLNSTTNYYVSAVYPNGCESEPEEIVITVNPLAISPIVQDASFCSSEDVILTATNVTGTLTWYSDGALTTSVGTGSPLNIGTQPAGVYNYFAQVNNGTCNSAVVSNTITVLSNPAAPVLTPQTICSGEQATLSVSSTNAVNWYSDAALSNLLFVGSIFTTPVLTGNTTYWVTISDGTCESAASTVLVTVNPKPAAPMVQNDTVCMNETSTLTAMGAGGTCTWYTDAALSSQVFVGSSFTTPALTSTTTYYVTEDDGSCTSDATIVSVYINSLATSPVVQDASFCSSEDVILTATNVTGTLTWYSDAALTTSVGTGSPLNIGTQPAGVYNYFAQVNNGTCNSAVVSNTITVLSNPAAPVLTPQTICSGEQATLSVSSTNVVNWYSDATLSNLLFVGSTFTTPVLTGNTTYWVTISDGTCESAASTVLVTVNPKPAAPMVQNDTVCMNETSTLTAMGSGGTYTWYTDATLSNQVFVGSSFTTPALTSTTTYYVTEDDGSCTSDAAVVTVAINTDINITIDSVLDVLCFGGNTGAVYISVSGGSGVYTYAWTGGTVTEDLTNATVGNYTLTVTDGFGCTASINAVVSSPTELVVTADNVQNVSCNGLQDGAISVSVFGGTPAYSYSWSDGSAVIATTKDLNNLGAGTYTLTVTDANMCTETFSATITENMALMGTIASTDILCYGSTGSAIVTASGGQMPYSYLWSNFDNTDTAINLIGGSVSVIITDANNCTIQLYDTIQSPAAALEIIEDNITHVTCFNGNDGAINTSLVGGTPPYTLAWMPNVGTTEDISSLSAGTYTLTLTDANNCSTTKTFEVNNAAEIASTMSVTNPNCYGEETGMISVGVSGGAAPYSYSWNTTPVQAGVVAINLAGDASYEVTITDANGCVTTDTAQVVYPPEMIVSTIPTSVSCVSNANGSVAVSVQNGNAPYQYELNGFLQADSVFNNLDGGNYIVFVRDNNNCTASASFDVNTVSGLEAELQGAGNDMQFVTDNLYIIRGEEVKLNVNLLNDTGNPIVGYNWSPSGIDDSNTLPDPSFNPVENVKVVVEVLEDINGSVCSVFDTLYIDVSQESVAFIPTAFTPNDNGANNFFEMNVLGATNLDVQIFNRWGEVVFSNENQGNGPNNINDPSLTDGTNPRGAWDGKYKGEDVPTGAYAYKVNVTYFDGNTKVISGTVTVIR